MALGTVIRRVLTAAGYEVEVAADAREARVLAEGLGGRLRLILSDVILPGANGPTIVDELRRASPGVAAMFLMPLQLPPPACSRWLWMWPMSPASSKAALMQLLHAVR